MNRKSKSEAHSSGRTESGRRSDEDASYSLLFFLYSIFSFSIFLSCTEPYLSSITVKIFIHSFIPKYFKFKMSGIDSAPLPAQPLLRDKLFVVMLMALAENTDSRTPVTTVKLEGTGEKSTGCLLLSSKQEPYNQKKTIII